MPRKKRDARGQLRPTIVRRRRRLNQQARKAWLARFKPGVRARFAQEADLDQAVWLGAFTRETGLTRDAAASLLGHVGQERRWAVLQTRDGLTVGIAPWKDTA